MKPSLPACLLVLLSAVQSFGEEPLHQRIDRLVETKFDGPPAPLADDAEFFRRANLDLAGRIPTAAATRAFLADTSPDKRIAAIDRLLEAPTYAEQMANLFHVMLMERRGDNESWERFLRDSFQKNRPWDELVRSILLPNREDEATRGSAYFYTRRLEKVGQNPTDHPGLTRDVGRLFLGIDLQCAECHDHLFIDDYKQLEFKGLFAVYKNISIRREDFPAVNEVAMTAKLDFVSVFGEENRQTGPRIPFGKEFAIPEPPMADPKAKKPGPNDPPSFSALQLIASELPSADSAYFRRNIANRLWFLMMGKGLVEPLDQFHAGNPPTHPELLDLLAAEIATHKFDLKWMIRELALTKTWQRSSRMAEPGDPPSPVSYQLANQRRLTADQVLLSVLQATGNLDRLLAKEEGKPNEEFKELKTGFLKAFAAEPKEPAVEYTPAVKQALFLINDSKWLTLFEPHEGNLSDRLAKLSDTEAVEELYLSVFCRPPTDDERAAVENHLKNQAARRQAALADLAWAMLTSMEFGVNH